MTKVNREIRKWLQFSRVAVLAAGVPLLHAGAGRHTPGEQDCWTIRFATRLVQSGEERPIEIGLSGELLSAISAVRPGEYDASLELANVSITGVEVRTAPEAARKELEVRLARRFWVTYREDGTLLWVHFFKDVSPADRNLLQMIASEVQLVGAAAERPVWSALERDGAGEYLAMYNRLDGHGLVKRKLKYVYTDASADSPVNGIQLAVEQSDIRFSLDAEGRVAALDATNRVRIGPPGGSSLVALTEIHLAAHRRSTAPEIAGSLSRSLADVVILPIATNRIDPVEARTRRDIQLLEGRTTGSLLEAAIANDGDPLVGERLAAAFRQRPAAAAAALEALRKGGPQKRITDALASAGSPAALVALGSLAGDRNASRVIRIDALNALVRVRDPGVEAMRLPASLMDDDNPAVEAAACMALGALAHAGRAGHPKEASAMDASLIARYRRATTPRERSALIAALGNSVGPEVVGELESVVRDLRDPLRASAVRALRLAAGPEIDRLLAAVIASDKDPAVRAAAIFAATFRPVGPLLGAALVRAARRDAVDYVRSSAITLLRQNPGASPDIGPTLSWVASHDAVPGIRRLAREELASTSGQPSAQPRTSQGLRP
jgi:hypothetical protein